MQSSTPTIYSPATNPVKIIGDCTYLLRSTTNPKTYFPKYLLLTEMLEHQALAGDSVSVKQLALLQENAEAIHEKFLKRAYCKLLLDVERLKTKISRVNKFKTFLQDVSPYTDLLTPANCAYLAEIKQDFQRRTYRW